MFSQITIGKSSYEPKDASCKLLPIFSTYFQIIIWVGKEDYHIIMYQIYVYCEYFGQFNEFCKPWISIVKKL